MLFLTNILTWETGARRAIGVGRVRLVGGLMTMGEVLNRTGSTTAFASWIGRWFVGVPWFVVLLLTLADLLLRALRLRQHHDPRAGDVSAVCRSC